MNEVEIRCKTKSCNKILATIAPGTEVARGFVHLICPRCKESVYIEPEPIEVRTPHRAA